MRFPAFAEFRVSFARAAPAPEADETNARKRKRKPIGIAIAQERAKCSVGVSVGFVHRLHSASSDVKGESAILRASRDADGAREIVQLQMGFG